MRRNAGAPLEMSDLEHKMTKRDRKDGALLKFSSGLMAHVKIDGSVRISGQEMSSLEFSDIASVRHIIKEG
jgi:hypothetical protein